MHPMRDAAGRPSQTRRHLARDRAMPSETPLSQEHHWPTTPPPRPNHPPHDQEANPAPSPHATATSSVCHKFRLADSAPAMPFPTRIFHPRSLHSPHEHEKHPPPTAHHTPALRFRRALWQRPRRRAEIQKSRLVPFPDPPRHRPAQRRLSRNPREHRHHRRRHLDRHHGHFHAALVRRWTIHHAHLRR